MDVIANALPGRPIKVVPVKPSGSLTNLLLGLFLLALAPLFWWLLGNDLMQDMLAPNDLQQARDVRVTEARCKTKAFIFTDCSIKTSAKTFEYLFIRSELADTVGVLRSPSKPGYLTTTIGQDQVVGRVTMFGLFMVLFVGGGIALLWLRGAQRAAAKRFAGMDGKILSAGLVTLKRVTASGRAARRFDYAWTDAKVSRTAFTVWPNALEPVVIGGTPQRLLAVRPPAGGTPMLVDYGFASLDLSEAEQKQMIDAVNAHLAKEQPA